MSYLYFWKDGNAYRFTEGSLATPKELITVDEPAISSVRNNGTTTIHLNLAAVDPTVGNRRLVEDFEQFLVDEKITEVTPMSGMFKVLVDTVIYDANRNVINEGVKIHGIAGNTAVTLLGISNDDELEYTFVKNFQLHIPYMFPTIASGITMQRKAPRYIRIRNISIIGGFLTEGTHDSVKVLNQTLLDHTISPVSPTLEAVREDGVLMFSADNIGVIDLIEAPTTIDLSMDINVGGLLQVFDESKIAKILVDNMNENPDTPTDPVDPDNPGGGCQCEEDKFFEKYERTASNNPKAGLVVSDADYAAGNYSGVAYPYSDVVVDIPDITVGEYVEYVKSLVLMSL